MNSSTTIPARISSRMCGRQSCDSLSDEVFVGLLGGRDCEFSGGSAAVGVGVTG